MLKNLKRARKNRLWQAIETQQFNRNHSTKLFYCQLIFFVLMPEYRLQHVDQGVFQVDQLNWSLIEVKDGKVNARGLHTFLAEENN